VTGTTRGWRGPKGGDAPDHVTPESTPGDGVPHLAKGTDEHVGDTRKFKRQKPAVVVLAIIGDEEGYAGVLEWVRRRGMVVEVAQSAEEGLRMHR